MELKTLYFSFDWLLQNEPFSLFYLKETTNYRIYMYLNAGFLVRWLMRNWSHRKYYALLDCANVAAVGSCKQNLPFYSGKNIASTMNECRPSFQRSGSWCTTWNRLGTIVVHCACFLDVRSLKKAFLGRIRRQRGTLQTLAQRKQELAVKVVKVFVIFMGLFVLFFSRFAIWSFDATCSFRVYDNPCLILSAYGKQIH